jgi:hypothetical protein
MGQFPNRSGQIQGGAIKGSEIMTTAGRTPTIEGLG